MTSTFELPKRILVPVDLSVRSEAAVAYAASLARPSEAQLIVMTHVGWRERGLLEQFAASEHLSIEAAACAELSRVASRNAPAVQVDTIAVTEGHAADSIIATATEIEADMIVMTSHGHGGMRDWLLGGTAEKVVRAASVPVVVVPTKQP